MKKIKKTISFSLFIAFTFLSSCNLYNDTEFKDPNKGDEKIYGNIDGPPKQAENSYPEATEETKAIQKAFEKEIKKEIEN